MDRSLYAVDIISKLNSELRDFLEHSLNSESFWEKWRTIDFGFSEIRCWEIKSCNKESCPSYKDTDLRCWLRVGTMCQGSVQGDFAKKYRSCFQCNVFKLLESDPLRMLYENINILIHHLKGRDEKIVNAAIRDSLTGAYNRSYFNEFMQKFIARSNRYGEVVSFSMIDLDGFKQLNDTHGHAAGDCVLVETALILQCNIRSSDLLFRYGGDEFLVVFPHADCEDIYPIMNRLENAVNDWNKQNTKYKNFLLSFSIGCSIWKKGDDLLSKLKEADMEMYNEKNRKKNGLGL